MSGNYKKTVLDTICDAKIFVKAAFTGGQKQWVKVNIRPVVIKGKHMMQCSYLTKKQDITKNYVPKELVPTIKKILQQEFRNITIHTTEKLLQIQIPQKGKAIIHEHAVSKTETISLSHDQQKSFILSPDIPLPFLQTLGIMTSDGKVKADKQHKFKQINEFLKIIDQTVNSSRHPAFPPAGRSESEIERLNIVDFGCGSGYLTLAINYYFTEILKKQTQVTGIDLKEDVLDKLSQEVHTLGWENVTFEKNTIIDYIPNTPADIVIALHACDTATDEALAQAISMKSTYIFSSPCCHHNLQEQLRTIGVPAVFNPTFRYAILAERMGDILTDTFRGLILQIMGYKTDVIEFISSEHTAKNLLIRAEKKDGMRTSQYIHEYKMLKQYWKVTPYLETLLGKQFTSLLTQ